MQLVDRARRRPEKQLLEARHRLDRPDGAVSQRGPADLQDLDVLVAGNRRHAAVGQFVRFDNELPQVLHVANGNDGFVGYLTVNLQFVQLRESLQEGPVGDAGPDFRVMLVEKPEMRKVPALADFTHPFVLEADRADGQLLQRLGERPFAHELAGDVVGPDRNLA